MNATLLGILGYIVAQIAIGMALTRRTRTEEDYLLAGRHLGHWIATMGSRILEEVAVPAEPDPGYRRLRVSRSQAKAIDAPTMGRAHEARVRD